MGYIACCGCICVRAQSNGTPNKDCFSTMLPLLQWEVGIAYQRDRPRKQVLRLHSQRKHSISFSTLAHHYIYIYIYTSYFICLLASLLFFVYILMFFFFFFCLFVCFVAVVVFFFFALHACNNYLNTHACSCTKKGVRTPCRFIQRLKKKKKKRQRNCKKRTEVDLSRGCSKCCVCVSYARRRPPARPARLSRPHPSH